MKSYSALFTLAFACPVLADTLVDWDLLARVGFEQGPAHYDPELCGTPKGATVKVQGIRSIDPEPGGDNLYQRYSLIEESYATEEAAQERQYDIPIEKFKNSLLSKSCGLRWPKAEGKKVFIVHTDVQKFFHNAQALVDVVVALHSTPRCQQSPNARGRPAQKTDQACIE